MVVVVDFVGGHYRPEHGAHFCFFHVLVEVFQFAVVDPAAFEELDALGDLEVWGEFGHDIAFLHEGESFEEEV